MRKLLFRKRGRRKEAFTKTGCRVASSYPGTPSTEVTESAAKYDEIYCEWAPNERSLGDRRRRCHSRSAFFLRHEACRIECCR